MSENRHVLKDTSVDLSAYRLPAAQRTPVQRTWLRSSPRWAMPLIVADALAVGVGVVVISMALLPVHLLTPFVVLPVGCFLLVSLVIMAMADGIKWPDDRTTKSSRAADQHEESTSPGVGTTRDDA